MENKISANVMVYGRGEEIAQHAFARLKQDILLKSSQIEEIRGEVLFPYYEEGENRIRNQLNGLIKREKINPSSIHIRKSKAVAMPVISLMGMGTQYVQQKQRVEKGQSLLMVGYCGLLGMLRIYEEKQEVLKEKFAAGFLHRVVCCYENIADYELVKTLRDGRLSYVTQLGEGGIFQTLYEMAKEQRVGFVIDIKKIPILQETVELAEVFRLNPYQLDGTGAFLIATKKEEQLISDLRQRGWMAKVIGNVTDNHDMIVRNQEDIRYLDRPVLNEMDLIL